MSDEPRSPEVEPSDAAHHALLSLHALAGDVDRRAVPEPLGVVEALNTVAQAPESDIPASARLGVLYSLARAQLLDDPKTLEGAHRLARSLSEGRDWLAVPDLVEEVKGAAARNEGLSETPNGRMFAHHETAFVGKRVCTAKRVRVRDREAIAIFSEFETDAPFHHVAHWIAPTNWSKWGPDFFKQMAAVASNADIVELALPPGDEHWTGLFREEVRLPLRRITTFLKCAYWKDTGGAAGMTYDLALSQDGQLDVDEGYLLVNQSGGINHVKVLKIVGFTNDLFDELALWVCPWWTAWISQAVEGGTSSRPLPPGGSDKRSVGAPSCVDAFDEWMDLVGQSAHSYFDIVEDAASRARTSGYTMTDLMEHGRSYWSQLAKDWATAWTLGLGAIDAVSQDGLDGDLRPSSVRRTAGGATSSARGGTPVGESAVQTPGSTGAAAPAGAAEAVPLVHPDTVIVPVEGLGPADRPVVSDLVSIAEDAVTIPSARIVVDVVSLGDSQYGVRLRTTAPVPHGLYVGHVTGAGSDRRVSVQLYVERAGRT